VFPDALFSRRICVWHNLPCECFTPSSFTVIAHIAIAGYQPVAWKEIPTKTNRWKKVRDSWPSYCQFTGVSKKRVQGVGILC